MFALKCGELSEHAHTRTHTHTPKNGSTKVLKIRAGMNALNGGLPQVSGWGEVLRWVGVMYSGGLG